MIFVRIAFWLVLIILLLPIDEPQPTTKFSNLETTPSLGLSRFCDQNPNTCAAGPELWATFLKKAALTIHLVKDIIEKRSHAVEPAAYPGQPLPRPFKPARDTLMPADLAPSWRGQAPRPGA
jgi:hypothetical protein